jgi:hypothetical protein
VCPVSCDDSLGIRIELKAVAVLLHYLITKDIIRNENLFLQCHSSVF